MVTINGKKVEIHLKGGFSERKGIKHFSDIIQVKDLNERTRNKLYNVIIELLSNEDTYFTTEIIHYIYTEIFSLPDDDIPLQEFGIGVNYGETFETIKSIFNNNEYNDVFDFIEGIIQSIDSLKHYYYQKDEFIENINDVFVKENVNYRIINDTITDIVNEETIKEIEETLENPYNVVANHYSKALELLYKTKDYDNSIKESISSVESICQILTGKDKATLGDALKLLKDKIHPAMKSAFEKLYGYTSDTNGIRHANGLGEGNSTFEEAKYMLISCSAFVNYLKEIFEEDK